MRTRASLASILRRLADRLSPSAPGDCGSGSTWVSFGQQGEYAAGAIVACGIVTSRSGGQLIADNTFESGPTGDWVSP